MTKWSPKQHHPKTTTISRRLRNRANQNISVQPQEIPELRSARPRRAATLSTPRHDSPAPQIQKSHQSPPAWDTQHLTDDLQISGNSHSIDIGVQAAIDFTLVRAPDFTPYEILQDSGSAVASNSRSNADPNDQHIHPSVLILTPSSLPRASASQNFEQPLSADLQQSQTPFIDLQEMSTLGFMMAPSQYGMHHYGSPPSYPQNYPPASQHGYAEQRSSTSGPYDSSYASSPALAHDQRRPEDPVVHPSYQSQPPLSRSPYQQQQPLSSLRSNSTPLATTAQSYAYPPSHGSVPSQPLGGNASSFPSPPLYPPATYGVSDYHPLPTMYPPTSTTPAAFPSYGSPPGIQQQPTGDVPPLSPSPGTQGSAVMPRILNSRPKPQCWEHGCNGRQFSTFSNLLRHQREKSGTASKSYCPRCGAEFTRTTARNGHMAHDKCKPRRPSESSH